MTDKSDIYKKICEFEDIIDYKFSKKDNLILALTHSSYANETKNNKIQDNERIEFLGDAVLNIAASELIYKAYPELAEGDMTKLRASVVCEPALAQCSNVIKLGNYLLLGHGEELSGGRTRSSVLCDAFEAVIGAIYLDAGLDEAKKFIYKHIIQLVHNTVKGMQNYDYKTQLQEMVQESGSVKIAYNIIRESGPDHDKSFTAQVCISDIPSGKGEGKSKKEAEQNAAKTALKILLKRNQGEIANE